MPAPSATHNRTIAPFSVISFLKVVPGSEPEPPGWLLAGQRVGTVHSFPREPPFSAIFPSFFSLAPLGANVNSVMGQLTCLAHDGSAITKPTSKLT